MAALAKLHNWTLAGDGPFGATVSTFETAAYRRVMLSSDEGDYQGYERIADGALFPQTLSAPNAAKIAADAAAATASAALVTKDAAADAVIAARVAATRPKMPQPVGDGTATAIERWLMALSWKLNRLE
jgi:hypothetical protein